MTSRLAMSSFVLTFGRGIWGGASKNRQRRTESLYQGASLHGASLKGALLENLALKSLRQETSLERGFS